MNWILLILLMIVGVVLLAVALGLAYVFLIRGSIWLRDRSR